MRRIHTTLAALCAALALTATATMAQTGPADRATYVTFSGPVSVPGMVLPAGTYTFRIMDSMTDRNIVQIYNRDRTKLFTTLLAIPAQRPEPEGDPVITFKETASNRPPAVHFWYYAGEKAGNELVYPREQALAIARASGEPVMAVESSGSSIDDWKSGGMSRVTAETATDPAAPVASAPAQQPEPAPAQTPATPEQPTAQAPAAQTTPSASASTTGTSGTLPATASPLPLVGLIGLLALAGALAVRAARA